MTAEEEAFLASIAAAPEDEAPHKVFADWLDEHDRPEDAAYHRRWTIAVAISEAWLQQFCSTADCPDYKTMMHALKTGKILRRRGEDEEDTDYFRFEWDREYLHFGGMDAHGEIPPEFWNHVETALGMKIGADERPSWFSCSC